MTERTRLPWKRHGHNHAQIHFPPLTAEEALLAVKLLERVIDALWRAHGDSMADFLARCDPDDAVSKEPLDAAATDAPDLSGENLF